MAAKQFVAASRAAMEAILRPYGLGGTQWWVVAQLALEGQLRQRDLAVAMHVERATVSEIVLTLVRKGMVEQRIDPADQRQKVLHLTEAGQALHAAMPNPMEQLYEVAFAGCPTEELTATARVLQAASARLEDTRREGDKE
ncbi:MAG: MarR family winged helix-turn-helix transcriptional regulator [Sciscionella sp.]